jgi:hypothetical protein
MATTLLKINGKSYIYDINLKIAMLRYLVGDIKQIPGIDFGPKTGMVMTNAQYQSFCGNVTMNGPSLSQLERDYISARHPFLLDKLHALYEAICLAPTMWDMPPMHAIRMLIKFHENKNEQLLKETWDDLIDYMMRNSNSFKYLKFTIRRF